jgi:hypothetical protein
LYLVESKISEEKAAKHHEGIVALKNNELLRQVTLLLILCEITMQQFFSLPAGCVQRVLNDL